MSTIHERVGKDYQLQIPQVSFRRMNGELKPDGRTECDVIGCVELAICIVGGGQGHPSCEDHAKGADYISPLKCFWPEGERG